MNYGLATARQCFESHHAAVRPDAIRRYKYYRGAYFLCASQAVSMAVRHRAVGHFDLFRDWDDLHRENTGKALVRVCGSYVFLTLGLSVDEVSVLRIAG